MNERELQQRKMYIQNGREKKIILKREIEVGRVKGEYRMEGIINEAGKTRDHVYSENGRA